MNEHPSHINAKKTDKSMAEYFNLPENSTTDYRVAVPREQNVKNKSEEEIAEK